MKITIKEYLDQKGIHYREVGDELIAKCLFNNCDNDSKGSEAHLYFNSRTGQHECKKCGVRGNLVTLIKFFGGVDKPDSSNVGVEETTKKRNTRTLTPALVEKYHQALPQEARGYLNGRGISDEIIGKNKIGYGTFYGSWWITIPIKDIDGNYSFFKLRQDPEYGKKKMTWPSGIEAQIFEWNDLINADKRILLVAGEMDALLMKSLGINCISGTHGEGTFKESWLEHFNKELPYYICYDKDTTGITGAQKVASMLNKNGFANINIVTLPEVVGEKGDLGDYVSRLNLPIEDLFATYSREYPEKIDTSVFQPISTNDIIEIMEPVIKKDNVNKVITVLALVNTYTEESQMNIFFSAPSSTGKSHIPLSVAELFPSEDLVILANCSPTAFIHEQGKYNKETNEIKVDLSRKILIFTDMPHPELLTRLRSFLSHDQKESKSKITDKSEKGGNRTKTVVLIGFPTVVFCSAGLKVDEQESTRFLMLSPSIEQDKLVAGIKQSILKEVDRQGFKSSVDNNEQRSLFKRRIIAIKQEKITDVKIGDPELIERLFLHDASKAIRPRQQRDIKKVICLIKGFALLNLWFRKRENHYIHATEEDILAAFDLWNSISLGQDYGLASYVYAIYTDIIVPLWKEHLKNVETDANVFLSGIERKEILKKHSEVYGRPLNMIYLRQHILPQLEQAGLIAQEKSTTDGRHMVVFPLELEEEEIVNNNSAKEGGVKLPEVMVEKDPITISAPF